MSFRWAILLLLLCCSVSVIYPHGATSWDLLGEIRRENRGSSRDTEAVNALKGHSRGFSTRLLAEAEVGKEVKQLLERGGGVNLQLGKPLHGDSAFCQNSVQGRHYLADSRGFVCRQGGADVSTGCCETPLENEQYSCRGCNLDRGCCNHFEYCITCCLHPNRTNAEAVIKLPMANQSSAKLFRTVFDYCRMQCRSNSRSVVHENAYRSFSHHCFAHAREPQVGEGTEAVNVTGLSSGVRLLAAEQGVSCGEACGRINLRCQMHVLSAINNCDTLRKYFTCDGGCAGNSGPDQPAEVVDTALKHQNPGMCLVNQQEHTLSCDGRHPITRRLCPCGA